MKSTTLGAIKRFRPCKDGWEKLTRNLGTTDDATEVTYIQILESNGLDDAVWAIRTDKQLAVEFSCRCSEAALPIFEKKHPDDYRPRKAIEAARAWLTNPCEETKQAAASVAALAAAAATTSASTVILAAAAASASAVILAAASAWAYRHAERADPTLNFEAIYREVVS